MVQDPLTKAKGVVRFVRLVVEDKGDASCRQVSVGSDKSTVEIMIEGGGILRPSPSLSLTVANSHIQASVVPRLHVQVSVESLEGSLDLTQQGTRPSRLPCDGVNAPVCRPPRVILTQFNAQVAATDDVCMVVVVHIQDSVAHWNHAEHVASVVAVRSLARACRQLLDAVHTAPPPTSTLAPSSTTARIKGPLDLTIASKALALHLTGMAHLPANLHVFSVQEFKYHLVETNAEKATTIQTAVAHVDARADKLIHVSSVDMHILHNVLTGAESVKLDVHDLALTLPPKWKLMVFIKQVQQLFLLASLDHGRRTKPPVELTARITSVVATLALPNDRNNVVLKLTGRYVDIKSTITASCQLSRAVEETLNEMDTCFSVADYRQHVAKVVSFATQIAVHDVDLRAISAVQDVWRLEFDSISLAGDIHDVGLSNAATNIPRSRYCLGLTADVQRPTLRVDKVFVALEVIPVVVAAFDDLVNASMLEKDVVKVNPRQKLFGTIDVAVTESSWVALLTADNPLTGRMGHIRLGVDKSSRVDCHVADLTLGLSSARVLHLSQVHWAIQFVHQGSVANVDLWHAVVCATVTSQTPMENKLSVEWTTLVGVAKTFLTEQLLPPCHERLAQGFNALQQVSVSLALRPVQIGWSEANTPTLMHFEMNHVDVSFGAVKDSTGSRWQPQSFAVDIKSLQGFILDGPDIPTRPNSFVLQAASVHAVNTTVQANKHVPIQVNKLRLVWTVAIRDHIFHMVDIVHDDVVQLLEIARGHGSTSKAPTTLLVHQKSSPTSLLDLLHQGKLGLSDDATSTTTTTTSSTKQNAPGVTQHSNNHFPAAGLVLTKRYSLTLFETQIHVAEPDSKSSMVVASRQIQIELGKDPLVAYTMADIALTDMTCHVAPLDVDIGAGVLWYNPHLRNTLLQQILNECSITVKYNMALLSQATFVQVDMPSVVVGMDSNQFFQCFSVVRTVLLAPPKVPKPKPNVAPLTMDKSVKLKKVQAAVAEELRMAGLRSTTTTGAPSAALKCVAFRIGRAQCRFRAGPEDGGAEFVAIGMDEAEGNHVYFDDSCTKFGINMQWLEIQNLKPGSSSMCFDDPMAVVKPRLEDGTSPQIKTMLSIRAESKPLPPSQAQPGVRVFEMLEVSIFPGIPYDISIQLAVDFYELMFKFFFGNQVKTPMTAHEMKLHMANPMAKLGKKELARQPSLPTDAADDLVPDDDDEIAESSGAELFYFNYVRIGNICLHISCLGFVVNLTGFELELPHFVCQGKLCTWKQLLRKFEGHLAWHVTKESASSGLNHVKKKFMTLNKTFKRKDKQPHLTPPPPPPFPAAAAPNTKKESAENMATLFGPYHHQDVYTSPF
ncbi:hypothetical protein DYB38_009405 [Aphanomyces astaci]|uniref:Uncharacterized protein n=1 Tax=Aphanomyces astaci TaxID=112090 RepID=A0A397CPF1_APHAT|nr:hypothetical protein DYB38_009405 [Aphanomyces astaci]